MFKVEMKLNLENNKNFCYLTDGTFTGIYPVHNKELQKSWDKVVDFQYYSPVEKGLKSYAKECFRMNPSDKDVIVKYEYDTIDNVEDILIFEFETEEEAFYFKLKYGD